MFHTSTCGRGANQACERALLPGSFACENGIETRDSRCFSQVRALPLCMTAHCVLGVFYQEARLLHSEKIVFFTFGEGGTLLVQPRCRANIRMFVQHTTRFRIVLPNCIASGGSSAVSMRYFTFFTGRRCGGEQIFVQRCLQLCLRRIYTTDVDRCQKAIPYDNISNEWTLCHCMAHLNRSMGSSRGHSCVRQKSFIPTTSRYGLLLHRDT